MPVKLHSTVVEPTLASQILTAGTPAEQWASAALVYALMETPGSWVETDTMRAWSRSAGTVNGV